MKQLFLKIWQEQDGILSFEWTLLIVLLVIGIIGGLGAARDVVIDELGDTAQAVLRLDQSYSFAGVTCMIDGMTTVIIEDSSYTDVLGVVEDCDRS